MDRERESQLKKEQLEGYDTSKALDVLTKAFNEYEDNLIRSLKNRSFWFPRKHRDEKLRRLQILEDIKTTLTNKVEAGEIARQKLEKRLGNK